jgi:hypothetical protein
LFANTRIEHLLIVIIMFNHNNKSGPAITWRTMMTSSPKNHQPSVHPTHWAVTALRWTLESRDHELAIGQEIDTLHVADRELAVAVAHHLLDKHAHEAFGQTGLEIHIMPPAQLPSDKERSGFRNYKVSAEARRQARTLGIRGDVEARVTRMARRAARFTHPVANLRYERFIMRVEGDTITWIGIEDAASTR